MVKVGDEIRILRDRASSANVKKGDVFTVTEILSCGDIRVMGNRIWRFGPEDFEIISKTPPEKITQNGYEYLLVGPVKPEWLVDGAWVVGKIYGVLYQVIEGESNNFSFRDNHGRLKAKKISTIVNYYRPHEPKDWKWGDWAMYEGKRVFVVCPEHHLDHAMVSGEGFSNGIKYVPLHSLTPTF